MGKNKRAFSQDLDYFEEQNTVMITWEQFLRICVFHMLSARINSATNRPKIPPIPIYLYSQSACMCHLMNKHEVSQVEITLTTIYEVYCNGLDKMLGNIFNISVEYF